MRGQVNRAVRAALTIADNRIIALSRPDKVSSVLLSPRQITHFEVTEYLSLFLSLSLISLLSKVGVMANKGASMQRV